MLSTKIINNQYYFNARSIHTFLSIGRDFSTWIKYRINKFNAIINNEYFVIQENHSGTWGGSNKIEYYVSLDFSFFIVRDNRNNPKTSELLEYLYDINGTKIEIKEQKRLEYQFGDMLHQITGLEFKQQYPIDKGRFRLDFYLDDTLIVEYDEEQHMSIFKKDKDRMNYCIRWLNKNGHNIDSKSVIRVKKGFELQGLREIVIFLTVKNIIHK